MIGFITQSPSFQSFRRQAICTVYVSFILLFYLLFYLFVLFLLEHFLLFLLFLLFLHFLTSGDGTIQVQWQTNI
jgi:hypothetical protein